MTRTQIKNLEAYKLELQNQLDELQRKWLSLAAKGNVDVLASSASEVSPSPGAASPSSNRITIEEFKRVREELFRINIEMIEAQAELGLWQAEAKMASAAPGAQARLRTQMVALFHAIPEVARVAEKLEEARHRAADAERRCRGKNDPALVYARRQVQELSTRIQALWKLKSKELAARAAEADHSGDDVARVVREQSVRVESLKAKHAGYEKMLAKIDVANKQESSDSVKVTLVREELDSVREMKEAVSKRLEQLRFESKADARISKVSEARVTTMPLSDNRKKYSAAAALAVLFAVIGLFVTKDLKSARIDDVDALSRLVSIEAHAVPALPSSPASAEQRSSRLREQKLQGFLRSLDHLRVSLCDDEHECAVGRCLLVTSARRGRRGRRRSPASLPSPAPRRGSRPW